MVHHLLLEQQLEIERKGNGGRVIKSKCLKQNPICTGSQWRKFTFWAEDTGLHLHCGVSYRVINIGKEMGTSVYCEKACQIIPDYVYRNVLPVIHCKSNTLGEVAVSFHSLLFLSPHSFLSVWIKWPNKSSFRIFPAFSWHLSIFSNQNLVSSSLSVSWIHGVNLMLITLTSLSSETSHLSTLDVTPFLTTISYRQPNPHRQLTAVLSPWPWWCHHLNVIRQIQLQQHNVSRPFFVICRSVPLWLDLTHFQCHNQFFSFFFFFFLKYASWTQATAEV